MIDFEALNPAVKRLCQRLASERESAHAVEAEEKDRPRKLVSSRDKAAFTSQIVSVVSVGEDEERSEAVPDDATGADAPWAGKVRRVVVGDRVVTFQLAYDSLENTDRAWAWSAVERIRTRLRRESSHAELEAVDAAINQIGPAVQANFKFEGRIVSRVLFTLVLNVHAEDVETDPTGRIKHVEWDSHAEDIDGDELPAPPNVTNEMTPPLEP